MTVDELNVKISADASSFKSEVAAANSELQTFRNRAVAAAAEINVAFDDIMKIIGTVSSDDGETVSADVPEIPEKIPFGPFMPELSAEGEKKDAAPTFYTPENAYDFRTGIPQRTADVPELERQSTLIGAVNGAEDDAQPVNITTSIILDGDKVGESVDRFLIRRNKITNGLESMT